MKIQNAFGSLIKNVYNAFKFSYHFQLKKISLINNILFYPINFNINFNTQEIFSVYNFYTCNTDF